MVGRQTYDERLQSQPLARLRLCTSNNSGQVVHADVPLSSSSVIWCH